MYLTNSLLHTTRLGFETKFVDDIVQQFRSITGKVLGRVLFSEVETFMPEAKLKLAACAPKFRRVEENSVPSSLNKFGGAVNALTTPAGFSSSAGIFSADSTTSSSTSSCSSLSSASSDVPRHSVTGTGHPLLIVYPEPEPECNVVVTHSAFPLQHKCSDLKSNDGGVTL